QTQITTTYKSQRIQNIILHHKKRITHIPTNNPYHTTQSYTTKKSLRNTNNLINTKLFNQKINNEILQININHTKLTATDIKKKRKTKADMVSKLN
ncbi:MAG: hypothetical protein KKG60_00400, partial [Nanoarchaeota archaeon]|nr:hypothetical protein [Nanoarchaeota archaeon]